MTSPLISVVIPTKERCETLKYVLETALNQSSDDYEIVVSDNFSQDDTKKVVESFADPKIKYLNTGRRLGMCDNWEYALNHASGRYIIFIGDDDGLMPNAVTKLRSFINEWPSLVYYWRAHGYIWPIKDEKPKIWLISERKPPHQIDLRRLTRFSINWGGSRLYTLPMVYHSAIAKSILDDIRRKTGRVFHTKVPDIFTAFAIPAFTDSAISVGEALSVNAWSGKSNSASLRSKDGAIIQKQFVEEYQDSRMHPSLYPGSEFDFLNAHMDAILTAMDLFPDYYRGVEFNYAAMWAIHNKLTGFKQTLWILKQRKKINAYHKLRAATFVAYSLAQAAIGLGKSLHRKALNLRAGYVPPNVLEFVNLMTRDCPNGRVHRVGET